jgi:putative ABC transport system substrate-binding protein
VSRVAFLSNPGNSFSVLAENEAKAAAGVLGITLHSIEARNPDQLERAFAEAANARAGAMLVVQDPMFFGHRGQLAALAIRNRLPTMHGIIEHVEAGGLMAYASNRLDMFRRAAGYVDRILKGAKPGDLPIEQPTKFDLVISLKTAKKLGLTIPPSVLTRADEAMKSSNDDAVRAAAATPRRHRHETGARRWRAEPRAPAGRGLALLAARPLSAVVG